MEFGLTTIKHGFLGVCLAAACLVVSMVPQGVQAGAQPQPSVVLEPLRVHLLGTGSPLPDTDRFGPAILVEAAGQFLLFDAGRGAIQRVQSLGIPFSKIDKLFITHLHSDHTVGVADVFLTSWLRGRHTPFHVWGPQGTQELMTHTLAAYASDMRIRLSQNAGDQVKATEIASGVVYDQDGLRVTAFEVDHNVKGLPSFGFRIDFQGRSVVLSGDTVYNENLIYHAQGVDLLVHEVAATSSAMAQKAPATQRIVDIHTTPEQAGRIFAQTKPGLAVYSHIVLFDVTPAELLRQTRSQYQGPLVIGEDLMTFELDASGSFALRLNRP